MFHQAPSEKSIKKILDAGKAPFAYSNGQYFNRDQADIAVLYSKSLIKFKKCNNHIWFYKQCLKYNLVPSYMKISCNSHSHEANLSIQFAYKQWIKAEMKKLYFKRDNLSQHQKLIHTEMVHRYSKLEFEELDYMFRKKARLIASEQHKKHVEKLDKLKKPPSKEQVTSSSSSITNLTSPDPVNIKFYDRVKNYSTCSFTPQEINLLSKGLKHCPNINRSDDLTMLAINTEIALDNLPKNFNIPLHKQPYANIINEYKQNPQPNDKSELLLLKSIKQKLIVNNLILCKADKGNTITILDKNDYISKTEVLIENDNYIQLKTDPTNKFQSNIKEVLKICTNFIKEQDKKYLTFMNPKIPRFYSLPKIHKEGVPMRPVVSYREAPAYKLCKAVCSILPDALNFRPKYAVKNSIQLVSDLKELELPSNAKLVSFDVVNLFSSIPVDQLIRIIRELVYENTNLSTTAKEDILLLMETCLDQSYFMFNNKFYKQKDGLPMGSPLSPLLSEIFMDYFEKLLFKLPSYLLKFIYFYRRYVDDVFCIWIGTIRQLYAFLKLLNSINEKIQFTMEIEQANSINYLDLTITRENKLLSFNIYRKTTFTDTLIPSNSKQSLSIKLSAFHSFIHRLFSLPLSETNFEKEVKTLKILALNNGYNESLIDQLISKKRKKLIIRQLYPVSEKSDNRYFLINYIPNLSNRICSKLKKYDLDTICINKNNLSSLLVNNKEKLSDIFQKSGIYQQPCNDCNAIYIGQTGWLKRRLDQHLASIRKGHIQENDEDKKKNDTGLSNHCIKNEHGIDINSCKLLYKIPKGKRMDFIEKIEITKAVQKGKLIVNEQINFNFSPIIQTCL